MRTFHARDSLRFSLKDGFCWSLMTGFTDSYYLPFAIFLGAGVLEQGFLKAFPVLLGSFLLFFVDYLLRRWKNRRKIVLLAIYMQAFVLLAASACAFMRRDAGLYLLIAAISIYIAAGLMGLPAWSSLMAEYLPVRRRGGYIGWRESLLGVALVFFGLVAGGILQLNSQNAGIGFAALLLAAAVARFGSVYYVAQMYEPPYREDKREDVDYFDFISGEAKGNIWRFAAGCSVLMAFTFVSAPFFSVYMLERLNFNYWQYTAVIMSGQLTTYAFSGFWGRMADEHGSRNVMAVTAVVLPVVPLLWALFTDWYFLCLVEFIAGVSWAAYARGVSNFMYDSAAPSLRTKYLAFFGMTIGVAQFAGSIAGGLFYKHLPRFFPNAEPFVWLLIISMIGRMSAGFLFLKVKEPVNRSLGARGFLLKVFDLRSLLIQR